MKRGLFVGRFQPFHLGHLQDIKNASKEIDELVIVVGSSNEENTKENPFTVKERVEMIDLVLQSNDLKNYSVYPMPDYNNNEKWVEHIKTQMPKFDVVYTGNNVVARCFKGTNCKVKKVKILKGISSTIIRNKMLNNEDWQSLVPKEVVEYISKIECMERVKGIWK